MILTLNSHHKGSGVSSLMRMEVKRLERTRPGYCLTSVPCVSIGARWQNEGHCACRNLCHLSQKVVFWNSWFGKKTEEETDYLRFSWKTAVKRMWCGPFAVLSCLCRCICQRLSCDWHGHCWTWQCGHYRRRHPSETQLLSSTARVRDLACSTLRRYVVNLL